ncbi:amino acid adenylation domain-containing protein [Micromonospora sp. DT229]|uniref:amino acid adenylation domain-containing protein n=1 Tax=Micromonospora sp. DT229 TaxID=3393430 RepID=UPI003CF5F551
MTSSGLYGWFHRTAVERPEHVALELDGCSYTYAELERLAVAIAATIVGRTGGTPTRVGLLTSRSIVTYAGYLAVLRLGASVVPMNPRVPAARNVMISTAAGLDATIVDDSSGYWCEEYVKKAGVEIIDLSGGVPEAVDEVPVAEVEPDAIAYIVFTSGSTGRPKGVPVSHANIGAFVERTVTLLGLGPDSRVSQSFELSFDAALNELFGAWAAGGTLCVPPHREVLNPVPFITARRLTHWFGIPSMISFALREAPLASTEMPTLRCSVLGGEALTREQALAWRSAAPAARMYNCFGPTELTLVCTAYEVGAPQGWPDTSNGTLPIGDLYPGLETVFLDEEGRPVADTTGGELCVRGPQRFLGYLDPADDVGRFVTVEDGKARIHDGTGPVTPRHYYRTGDRVRREHGELVHLGRMDAQVKIHGFRVELGEIEAVLRRHPGVDELVVIAIPTGDGGADLHALYTGDEIPAADFAGLAAVLPLYMRPGRYQRRAEFPCNANGKVDRRRLAAELSPTAGPA